jgi:hypothetical protein
MLPMESLFGAFGTTQLLVYAPSEHRRAEHGRFEAWGGPAHLTAHDALWGLLIRWESYSRGA